MADFDRPLNSRGQLAAPLMGERLQAQSIKVDIILASTARRVRETLSRLESKWEHGGHILWEKKLYLADLDTIVKELSMLDTTWPRVMLLGHNPGLSYLVSALTEAPVDMPTAAIAMLQGPSLPWLSALRDRQWTQRDYWTPKDEPTC